MANRYTCLSCQVVFADAQLQRAHYKCDWHRYNLKRKVADLPPVTAEEFQQRVLAQKSAVQEQSTYDGTHCQPCGKQFATQKAYENHVRSKKHQEALLKRKPPPAADTVAAKNARNRELSSPQPVYQPPVVEASDDDDSDWESVDGDEDLVDESDRVPPSSCLFCEESSDSPEANVKHMTSSHSFFIPDIEYLVDLEGLLTYLGYKIGVGKICLWCGDDRKSPYRTLRAVQQHMNDKGHCKMAHEGSGLLEYADFYDYSASYPDQEDGQDQDSEVDIPVLEGDGWQLVLPSGAVVGHRSLARYYSQNLQPARPRSEDVTRRLLTHYKALGWTGSTTREVAVQKARDLKFMRRVQAKQEMRLGVKANKLQKHFRQQVLF
ncbi:cytoplasmic 60S subunit biogenesis factor ZNF622-like [Ornithodoros turicata]|uniref:Putative ribosome bioproteinsis protein n=1 Tax=Ornithodoros turicata TaxID=34597 RepID=A0A2R5LK41_9ACAR